MILTLTGASGAGKTTIGEELMKILPIDAERVPSYTTRRPRTTDMPGEYKCVSNFRFRLLERAESFLWTVHVHGNNYGTTKRWVAKALRDDDTIYIMILLSGAVKTLRRFAEKKGLLGEVYSFYVLSPSQEVLRKRLENRGDGAEEIEKRLADCLKWDEDALSSSIPYEFVRNDRDVQEAGAEVKNRFLVKFENNGSLF